MSERTGRTARTVAGAAGLIAALTLASRLVGFGRILVFAESVRTGGVGGVYAGVNAVPNVFYEVAAGGILAAVAVPLIGAALGSGDRERAERLASVLLTWALTLLVPVAVLVFVLAAPLAALTVPAELAGGREVGTTLLRIFAVQIPLYGIGIILSGLLQAHRRFLTVALAPLLSSLVVLTGYLWYGALTGGRTAPTEVPAAAVQVLGWGTTAGVAVLSLPLLGPALRTGWRWRPSWRLPGADRQRLTRLAGGGLLALLAQQGATAITLILGQRSGDEATFAVYQYAQALYLLPYAVLAVPVAMSVFPVLAVDTAADRDAAPLLSRGLRGVLMLTTVAAGVLVAVARPASAFFSALDARRMGATSTLALDALPVTITTFAPGLVGFSLAALLTRALYVKGHPVHAGAAMAAGWATAALVPLWLLGGGQTPEVTLWTLGLWSSIGMTLSALLLALLVRAGWGPAAVAGSLRTAGVALVALPLAIVVGDLITSGSPSTGFVAPIVQAVPAAALAGFVGLLTFWFGDRATLTDLVGRGRARRRAGERR